MIERLRRLFHKREKAQPPVKPWQIEDWRLEEWRITDDFLAKNMDQIGREYAGKWIVVSKDKIVAADEDAYEAGMRARELGVDKPYFVRIPEPDEPPFISSARNAPRV